MILRDPVHGLVSFEDPNLAVVVKLLGTREMQRLRRIRQLGLASLVYPGAEHTRFSHAIGAAHVMTRLVQRLQQIDHELPAEQRVTPERARDLVVAALLHDIGHGPLSHLFEDAFPEGPCHEEWSRRVLVSPETEVNRVLKSVDSELPARTCELIAGRHPLPFLAASVSGIVDVDRCDYLLRDAHFTGVTYGQFDLEWLLRSLRLGQTETARVAPCLAIDGEKGLPAIESFVLARLFMFQQVYFHKAGRASEWHVSRLLGRLRILLESGHPVSPLPRAIESLLRTGDASLDDYLQLDDAALWYCFSEWRASSDRILRDLCERLCARSLFKTIELFGPANVAPQYESLLDQARQAAAAHGLPPEHYVGLDEARVMPFDDTKGALKVVFPSQTAHAPEDVSFVLGRLRGQELVRRRLIYPVELRDVLRTSASPATPRP